MIIQKGDRFRTTYSNQVYEVAGRWDRSIVLMPINSKDEECLIYSAGEIEELLETGRFAKEERSTL